MTARPGHCSICNTPTVRALDIGTGHTLVLNIEPHEQGRYEIQKDGSARLRLTKAGKPVRSGKGHAPHMCRASEGLFCPPEEEWDGQPIGRAVGAVGGFNYLKVEPPLMAKSGPDVPMSLRELVELVGPDGNVDDYHDWTGTPSGPATCGVCGQAVMVCYHQGRSDGVRPVILDERTRKWGPWKAYRKTPGPDRILCEFMGDKNAVANRFNHRLICPETRPST